MTTTADNANSLSAVRGENANQSLAAPDSAETTTEPTAQANVVRAAIAAQEIIANDQATIDHVTRELVILTRVRRALLLRGRHCLALMAPRRRQLAALLRRRNQRCHAIDRVGSVRIVGDKRALGVGGKKRSVGMVDATIAAAEATGLIDSQQQQRSGTSDDADVAISVSVLPYDDEHAALNRALDQAIDAAVGSQIWARESRDPQE
jgi:hypothetical protein